MGLPKDCLPLVKHVEHRGIFKPRFFALIGVHNLARGVEFVMPVRKIPFLFRLRAKMALTRACRLARKYEKFCQRNGL